jgi:hypothetical protein
LRNETFTWDGVANVRPKGELGSIIIVMEPIETTPSVADVGAHPQILPRRRNGSESLTDAGAPLGVELSDFWAWSTSDLIDNTTRGRLAEFIVATAVGVPTTGVQDSWAAWDLTMPGPEPIRIEVKSAAYLQRWRQKRYSLIQFSTRKTLAWDAETDVMETVPRRHAQVYVFALLAHKESETLDPLEVSQWHFFVLPTRILDSRTRSQHSITLPSLKKLTNEIHFSELAKAVRSAASANSGMAQT